MEAKYVSHMGSDKDVANDARISYESLAEMFTEAQNENLIRFLARGVRSRDWGGILKELVRVDNEGEAEEIAKRIKKIPVHWSPFAHNAIKLRMKAPLPIRTQCFKHKQGMVENEESRRYISSIPEIYIPRFREQAEDKKQGSGGEFKGEVQESLQAIYKDVSAACIATYQGLLDRGVCEEQARFILPQGAQVNWVWTGSLYAYANFYNKRSASDAQGEIQELAKAVGNIIKPLFPISWEALTGDKDESL